MTSLQKVLKNLMSCTRIRQKENHDYIVFKKLVPYVISTTLYKDGYLISEQNALPIAEQMFRQAKRDGRLNELNELVVRK